MATMVRERLYKTYGSALVEALNHSYWTLMPSVHRDKTTERHRRPGKVIVSFHFPAIIRCTVSRGNAKKGQECVCVYKLSIKPIKERSFK